MTQLSIRIGICILALAGSALAQDVGRIAAVTGEAEVGRGGAWAAAEVGMGVQQGDLIRTRSGQVRVIFQDESVLNLSEGTQVAIDEQVFDPEAGSYSSIIRLLGGKVRALVSEYYRQTDASYEVHTPTAVAGVRGTTFLVAYDADTAITEVTGIRGRVEVSSVDERLGGRVFVGANETTSVREGEPPSAPEPLGETLFRQQLEGVDMMARFALGAAASARALSKGTDVAPPDRAPPPAAATGTEVRDASDLVGQPLPVVETSRGRLGIPF